MRATKLLPTCSNTTQRSSRGATSTRFASSTVSLRLEVTSITSPMAMLADWVSTSSATPSTSKTVLAHLASGPQTLPAAAQSSVTLDRAVPASEQVPTLLARQVVLPGSHGSVTQAAPPLACAWQMVSLPQSCAMYDAR